MKTDGVVKKAIRIATLLAKQQRGTISLEERLELEHTVCRSDEQTLLDAKRRLARSAGEYGELQAAAA